MFCAMCQNTGMALYVQDASTEEIWGPFMNPMQVDDFITQKCAEVTYEKDGQLMQGISRMAGAWRFYQSIAACSCKRQPPMHEGIKSEIARLRVVLPEPSFKQFEGMTFETFEALNDPEKARGLKAGRYFAEQNGTTRHNGALFFGEPGAGKTGLMYFIYRERRPAGAIWCDYNEMLAVIHATYGKRESDTKQIMDALGHVPALFIDDMGDMSRAAQISDDARNKTYDIIRQRHEAKRLTIITSNLDQKAMRAQFGPRIYNRLRELCAWVHVGGRNLRERVAENENAV